MLPYNSGPVAGPVLGPWVTGTNLIAKLCRFLVVELAKTGSERGRKEEGSFLPKKGMKTFLQKKLKIGDRRMHLPRNFTWQRTLFILLIGQW